MNCKCSMFRQETLANKSSIKGSHKSAFEMLTGGVRLEQIARAFPQFAYILEHPGLAHRIHADGISSNKYCTIRL